MSKKKPLIGRPMGTGAGYTEMVRVMLTKETAEQLKRWKERNGAVSTSEAVRRIIEQAVSDEMRPRRIGLVRPAEGGKP